MKRMGYLAQLGALIGLVLMVLAVLVLCATARADKYYRPEQSNRRFMKDVNLRGNLEYALTEVDLTSPSKTIDVDGATVVVVTTDANQTGAQLANGTVGQEVTIVMGAGSNTLRFDDNATTMALGGNITLTEGQSDTLKLLCTADGQWADVGGHDN